MDQISGLFWYVAIVAGAILVAGFMISSALAGIRARLELICDDSTNWEGHHGPRESVVRVRTYSSDSGELRRTLERLGDIIGRDKAQK